MSYHKIYLWHLLSIGLPGSLFPYLVNISIYELKRDGQCICFLINHWLKTKYNVVSFQNFFDVTQPRLHTLHNQVNCIVFNKHWKKKQNNVEKLLHGILGFVKNKYTYSVHEITFTNSLFGHIYATVKTFLFILKTARSFFKPCPTIVISGRKDYESIPALVPLWHICRLYFISCSLFRRH